MKWTVASKKNDTFHLHIDDQNTRFSPQVAERGTREQK
jgi:hypothetical protein